MKLNQAQFPAQGLAEDHPAVAQFCELFGHHTFFLDGRGLSAAAGPWNGRRKER